MTDPDAAFVELVRSHGDSAFRLAVLLAGGVTAGQDLLQTVYEQMCRHYRRHGAPESPAPYLRASVVRQAVKSRRLVASRPEILVGDLPDRPGGSPEAAVLARQQLLPALHRLPARQRAVIVLRYYLDLSEADIAMALGCSVGAVKTQAHRALRRLRADQQLSEYTPTRLHPDRGVT